MRWCRAAALLLLALLLGSVPSLAQTPVTIIGPVTVGNCVKFFSPIQIQDAGSACGTGGGGAVSSVSNSDSTLTFSPTTGAVVGSLNLAHANTWSAAQTFSNGITATSIQDTGITGAGTQCVQASATGVLSGTGSACGAGGGAVSSVSDSGTGTMTISPTTGSVLVALNLAHSNTWTVAQTFAGLTASSLTDTGLASGGTQCVQASTAGLLSGTGAACGSGSGAVNSVTNADGTLTISPTTGAVVASIALGHANTWSATQTFGAITVTTTFTATGLVKLTDHAVQAANTVVGNATAGSASPTALAMPSCSTAASALNWTTSTGFTCNTSITAAAVPASGLTGTTLASNVVTSSLTTVGTLIAGATGAGFTINFTASTESGTLGLTNGGTNNALTASAGGIVWSDASKLNILAGTVTASQCLLSGSSAAPSWGTCGPISSVSNSDLTLNVSPTTGAVIASLNLAHANTWSAAQTFSAGITVSTSFTATGLVTLADHAVQAANTVLDNPTGSSASPTAQAVPSCSAAANALIWTTNAGFGCNSAITAAAVPANGLTGTTLSASVVTSSLTTVGTLIAGGTGAGFTIALGTSTVTGILGLTNGGTAASLTASNGGIVYSSGSALAILAGTVTASQCLLSGSNAAPSWGSCSGAAAVSSVTNADGTLTISPTTGSVVASLALGHANLWTALPTVNIAGIAATSTDGLVIENTTAAGAGAQQWSPRLHFIGQGWKTNATAGSQPVDWIAEAQPVQGAANPSSKLVFSSQANAGGYTALLSLSSLGDGVVNVTGGTFGLSGNITAPAWTTAGIQYADLTATLTDSSSSGTVAAAYTSKHGGNTIAASAGTTYTNYYNEYFKAESAGTNVTMTNSWALGADNAQINGTLNVTGGALQLGGSPYVPQPQGRLTLVTGTPVIRTSQTAKSQIFYDCYGGNLAPVYNGTYDVVLPIPSCEISDTMPTSGTGVTNSGGVFDEWAVAVAGALAICHATNGSGGGWASDTAGTNTARGTGYSQIDTTTRSYITNKNSITNCYTGATQRGPISANQATYLGTLWATAAGQTGMNFYAAASAGGNPILGLFNGPAQSQVPISVCSADSAVSWTYASTTWHAANGSNSNRVSWVDGLQQVTSYVTYSVVGSPSTTAGMGIGTNLNSTSAVPLCQMGHYHGSTGTSYATMATSCGYPPGVAGQNFVSAMEASFDTSSVSFYGTGLSGVSPPVQQANSMCARVQM
jgi:hypothetical protein